MKYDTDHKLIQLKKTLQDMGSVAIGFSGGVDSTFLAAVAYSELGKNAVAFTALSASYPQREKKESASLSDNIGKRQVFFESEGRQVLHAKRHVSEKVDRKGSLQVYECTRGRCQAAPR